MPATVVKTLIYEIKWDDGDASKKADAWDRKLNGQGSTWLNWGKIGTAALMAVGEAISDLTIGAGKNFAIYEDTLSHARRTMGLTRDETLDLGDAMIALSTSFAENGLQAGISANELAKIAGQLGQLGFSARDNIDGFNDLVATVAKVSVAFGISSAKTAEQLGILQNLYGFTQEEFSNVASSIAYLGNTTVATSAQILDIMTRVGGIAGILGVSAQQMAGISATLREAGVSAQVGGTAMSQIFSRLASDVDKFGEVLGSGGLSGDLLRMKIETGDATGALKDVLQAIQNINASQGKIAAIQALKDLGLQGVRVQQTLLALSNNIGGLNTNLAKSEEAFRENTAVNEAYQAAIDNTYQKWNQFQNLLDAIQKMIGKDLSIAFGNFLEDHLIPFTEDFKDWLETSKGAEKIFGESGIIAEGLNYLGELLDENGDSWLTWLDNIDEHAPVVIENLKQVAIETFGRMREELEIMLKPITDLRDMLGKLMGDIDDIGEKIEPYVRRFEDLWNTWREFVKLNREFMKDLDTVVDHLGWSLVDKLAGAVNTVKDAVINLGKEAMYSSVFPDLIEITKDATKVLNNYGTEYDTVTGKTKFLYQTGANTWSNINREIQTGTDRWVSDNQRVAKSAEDVEFQLYQTGDAIRALAGEYGNFEIQRFKALSEADIIVHDVFANAVKLKNLAGEFVTQALAGNTALGQVGITDIASNLLTSQGLISQQQAARSNPQNGLPQMQTGGVPAPIQGGMPQSMNVTLVMGDQEVGNLVGVIEDRQQQNDTRSFGGRWR